MSIKSICLFSFLAHYTKKATRKLTQCRTKIFTYTKKPKLSFLGAQLQLFFYFSFLLTQKLFLSFSAVSIAFFATPSREPSANGEGMSASARSSPKGFVPPLRANSI